MSVTSMILKLKRDKHLAIILCVTICLSCILVFSDYTFAVQKHARRCTPSKFREDVDEAKVRLSHDLVCLSKTVKLKLQYYNDRKTKIFKHAARYRPTAYPFLSGDTFRAIADHVFDDTSFSTEWAVKVERIQNNDIVFVKTDFLCEFFALFHRITSAFVLITHNGDVGVPGIYKSFLRSTKLLSWFATNPDLEHEKIHAIPIGLANSYVLHGNMYVVKHAFLQYRKRIAQRSMRIYINFNLETNRKKREIAMKHFATFPNTYISSTNTSFDRYLQDLGNSVFVVSPPGNGLDCHRTWEALLMGATPVVISSLLDPLFLDTPVMIVSSWKNVSEMTLSKHQYFLADEHVPLVLLADYWYLRIMSTASRRGPHLLFASERPLYLTDELKHMYNCT